MAIPLDDYYVRADGTIEVTKTNDAFDRFYTESSQTTENTITTGVYSLALKIDKNGAGLLALPNSYSKADMGLYIQELKMKIASQVLLSQDY